MASQQEMIPTSSSSLVQVVVFACQQLSIPRQSTGRREQNTFSHCMYRRRHFVSTSHMMLHAHAWLRLNSVPKTFSHSISCFAPCLTPCTVHPAFLSFFNFPLLSPSFTGSGSRSITSRIHWADSRHLGGDGFTDPEPSTQHEDDGAA